MEIMWRFPEYNSDKCRIVFLQLRPYLDGPLLSYDIYFDRWKVIILYSGTGSIFSGDDKCGWDTNVRYLGFGYCLLTAFVLCWNVHVALYDQLFTRFSLSGCACTDLGRARMVTWEADMHGFWRLHYLGLLCNTWGLIWFFIWTSVSLLRHDLDLGSYMCEDPNLFQYLHTWPLPVIQMQIRQDFSSQIPEKKTDSEDSPARHAGRESHLPSYFPAISVFVKAWVMRNMRLPGSFPSNFQERGWGIHFHYTTIFKDLKRGKLEMSREIWEELLVSLWVTFTSLWSGW